MENNNAILSIPKGKVRCPWLGVNVAGARPITLATETVRASLKGVTVTDVAVVETQRSGTLHGGGFGNHRHGEAVRALEVTYVHGERRDILKHGRGGHGKVTFYDLGEVGLSVREWARKQPREDAGQNACARRR
jgi:hypothetical protein